MKKIQLSIGLLAFMSILALADYKMTDPLASDLTIPETPSVTAIETKPAANEIVLEPTPADPIVDPLANVVVVENPTPTPNTEVNLTQAILNSNPTLSTYQLQSRMPSVELFETFDLSEMTDLRIYKNVLSSTDSEQYPTLHIYEIQPPIGQGTTNYLRLKLAMLTQLGSDTTINETSGFGDSSLFYNPVDNEKTGFLLTQIDDTLFGFRYSKVSENSFLYIQNFITSYQNQT